MCTIKTGVDIQDEHDLQNLVTSHIIRAREPFAISNMVDKVMESCEGSLLNIADKYIRHLVTTTTYALLRCDYLDCDGEQYYPRAAKNM